MATNLRFNTALMLEDMAEAGWNKDAFARKAHVSDMTVIRFLRGDCQTNPTAKKLARALGHSVRRYLVSSRDEAVA